MWRECRDWWGTRFLELMGLQAAYAGLVISSWLPVPLPISQAALFSVCNSFLLLLTGYPTCLHLLQRYFGISTQPVRWLTYIVVNLYLGRIRPYWLYPLDQFLEQCSVCTASESTLAKKSFIKTVLMYWFSRVYSISSTERCPLCNCLCAGLLQRCLIFQLKKAQRQVFISTSAVFTCV